MTLRAPGVSAGRARAQICHLQGRASGDTLTMVRGKKKLAERHLPGSGGAGPPAVAPTPALPRRAPGPVVLGADGALALAPAASPSPESGRIDLKLQQSGRKLVPCHSLRLPPLAALRHLVQPYSTITVLLGFTSSVGLSFNQSDTQRPNSLFSRRQLDESSAAGGAVSPTYNMACY